MYGLSSPGQRRERVESNWYRMSRREWEDFVGAPQIRSVRIPYPAIATNPKYVEWRTPQNSATMPLPPYPQSYSDRNSRAPSEEAPYSCEPRRESTPCSVLVVSPNSSLEKTTTTTTTTTGFQTRMAPSCRQ
eukprot:scaffold33859_cov60-Attheya_sp.AAC.3